MIKKSFIFVLTLLIGFMLYLFFFINKDENVNNKEFRVNADVTSYIDQYREKAFQFQHRLFSESDPRPYTEGGGVVGYNDNCMLNATYTGALYKIDYHYKNFKLHSKTTKLGTSTETDWNFVLPFSSNHNSLIYSLAGNNKNMICSISNLAKVLDGSSGTYKINYQNLSSLLLDNYNKELVELDLLYNTKTFKKHKIDGFQSNISRLKTLDLTIKITKIDTLTTKISVLDKNAKVYEELTLRVSDSFMLEDLPLETISKNTEKLSDLL